VYFRCLSETAAPEEYTELVNAVIENFVRHDTPNYMSRALSAATREQKMALAPVASAPAQKARPRMREKEPKRL